MPERCSRCGGIVGDPSDCPHCGFRVHEHNLQQQVNMLEDAIAGWQKVSEEQQRELERPCIPWRHCSEHGDTFEDGESMMVAVPVRDNRTGKSHWEIECVVARVDDMTGTCSLESLLHDEWGWDWSSVEWWLPISEVIGTLGDRPMIPPGYREGPAVAYVPMLTSLADYQRNPRVPFPLGYRRCEVESAEGYVVAELRYGEAGDKEAEMPDHDLHGERHILRNPCVRCDCEWGRITTKNGQDCVYCGQCSAFQYNAPKTETGRKPRTVTTVHNGISPKQRARILNRATGRCELCGCRRELSVGHLLSVDAGLRSGMTEAVLNNDENLCAMCAECNLGIGRQPVSPRLLFAILLARVNGTEEGQP